jgi:hypothetical protein
MVRQTTKHATPANLIEYEVRHSSYLGMFDHDIRGLHANFVLQRLNTETRKVEPIGIMCVLCLSVAFSNPYHV